MENQKKSRSLEDVMRDRLTEAEIKEILLQAKELDFKYSLSLIRKESNKTQKELAELMGVSQATLSSFEKNNDLKLSTLIKYVEALGGCLSLNIKFPKGKIFNVNFNSSK